MNDNFWQILIAVLGGSGVWELIKFEAEKHKKKLYDRVFKPGDIMLQEINILTVVTINNVEPIGIKLSIYGYII